MKIPALKKIKKILRLNTSRRGAAQPRAGKIFPGTQQYWERRYSSGGTSGSGSYDHLAAFKADVVNKFVRDHAIQRVIEFGCGDGNQLGLAHYPRYLGLDVSVSAVERCRQRFFDDDSKVFLQYDPENAQHLSNFLNSELSLSLDVVFHLVEEQVYKNYLRSLFDTSEQFVIIYSSDKDEQGHEKHILHHHITKDVAMHFSEFRLIQNIPNRYPQESFCEFFIYERLHRILG